MLERLPIAIAHVKAGNTFENLYKSYKSYNLGIEQKKVLKSYITI